MVNLKRRPLDEPITGSGVISGSRYPGSEKPRGGRPTHVTRTVEG